MLHPSTIRFVQRTYNSPFSYISYSEKWIKNPLIDDAQSFKLATDHETMRSFHSS